ncbi:hypothetical protein ACHAXT_012717 [Thalassiosira profunda]
MTLAMAAAPPLPHLIISAAPSIRWPLRDLKRAMPPLHYLRPDEMTLLRTKVSPGDGPQTQWMNDVPGTIASLFGDNTNTVSDSSSQLRYDYTILSLSILLLGHGYTDECHSLVTPYSWPDEIHTSYGPVRYHTSDPGVVSTATYVHSLVHRKEGWNTGELGMVGWSNADYWGNAWRRPIVSQEELQKMWKEPIAEVQRAIRELVEDHSAGRDWCSENLELETETLWDPRALHRLCAQVTEESGANCEELTVFAEKAVEAELRALLHHCIGCAGHSISWMKEEA